MEMCDMIEDLTFWHGLKTVIGDIERICYGTNINHKDCMCADQVLLTLAGIYLQFSDHLKEDVKLDRVKHLEK